MPKVALIFLFYLSFVSCSNYQENYSIADSALHNLNGKVKSVVLVSNESNLPGEKTIYEYNRDGKEVFVTQFKSNSSIFFKLTNNYDINGKLTKSTNIRYDGTMPKEVISRYDSRGNDSIFFDGEFTYRTHTLYSNSGSKIIEKTFNSSGDLLYEITYDAKGKESVKANYDRGNLSYRIINKYDKKGNLTEEKKSNSFGIVFWKVHTKYDSNNYPFQQEQFNWCGSLHSKETYKYDIQGNQIETKCFNENGLLSETITYDYDVRGNWIKKRSSKNNIPSPASVVERTIKYY